MCGNRRWDGHEDRAVARALWRACALTGLGPDAVIGRLEALARGIEAHARAFEAHVSSRSRVFPALAPEWLVAPERAARGTREAARGRAR